jgi:gliding motility-associated-like protein
MSSEGQVTAPSTMDQYTWYYNGQPVGTGQNVLQSFPVSPSTTVTGFVVGTTSNGCADTAWFSVDLKPHPVSGFTFDDNCIGLNIPFTNNLQWNGTPDPGTTVNYFWNFGDGQTSTQENPTNNYASAGIYNVSLASTSSDGCTDTVTVSVTASPLPQASFEVIPQCFQNVVFVSTSTGNGVPLTGWNWNLGDGNSAADSSFTHEYANAGTYNVNLIVSNAQGCTDTATLQVEVVASVPLTSLDIPNIFTPNGDNVNDEIDIDQLVSECDEYEILIFNRWGVRVFRQEKGTEPFKGFQQGGGKLTSGVYFYTLRSGKLEKNGTITIAY